jgi:putative spermidine/putrescine transport system permease protein
VEVQTRGQRIFKVVSMAFLLLVLIALYAPLLVMTSLSFTEDQTSTFPPTDLSMISYEKLLHPGRIELFTIAGEPITDYWGPLQLSLLLGALTAVVATVLGLSAAIAFRQKFRGRNSLFFVLLLGMIAPGIVVGLGIRLLATAMQLEPRWYTTGLLVHVGWTLPFSFVIFMIFLNRFDRQIEEAASMLGATALQVFRHVTLPILRPAVLASLLFGFTLSFDELQRSALALGQDISLPRALVSVTTIRVTPVVYSLGAIIAIASLALVLVYLIMFERDAKKLYVSAAAKDGE